MNSGKPFVKILTSPLQNGTVIWKKANGIDNSPVEQYSERKSISTERTFDKDTIDVKQLKAILLSMTEKLAFQLRQEEKLTRMMR